ncbi:MAG: hypothetical protein R3311_09820, partial [Oceanisphaera sp.]|nr:hypothetical protein [Oceanisphaera sp.]
GIEILDAGTDNNKIYGNYIGTNHDGTTAIANGRYGVVLYNGVQNTEIGGTGTGQGNIISGNPTAGIIIDGANLSNTHSNTIVANYIGVASDGSTALGNGDGIRLIQGANNNTIGGDRTAGEGNVISGNSSGIYVTGSGSDGNVIQGNLIGTDVTGTVALSNSGNNIDINQGASNTLVGGAVNGTGNVIAAGGNDGITIWGGGTTGTIVQGNFIGTDTTGTLDLGNSNTGVVISGGSTDNQIGGADAGEGNIVAFNNDIGVEIRDNSVFNNAILGNSIYSNTLLGIDLGGDGVTANDVGDADSGASNNLQNYPVLTKVQSDGTETIINGTLNSTPNSYFRIEFFASDTGDGSGYGEAQTYLGFVNITTDGSGHASFTATLNIGVSTGNVVSATATKSDATFSAFTDTSELGANVIATEIIDVGAAIFSNASNTPQTNDWDGSTFGTTGNTSTLLDTYRTTQGADAPTRDEKIVVGIDNSGNVSLLMWDGSSWSSTALAGTVTETYWYGAEVAYEQQSGDAVVVWNNGSQLQYAVWDGSSWTAPQSIGAYTGAEPQNLRLAFDPGSDAMALVVNDINADDYALIWDGSSWGNQILLDASGTAESDQSAIAVAFEAHSGNAMVTYGKNADAKVYYRVWNGTSWESEGIIPSASGVSGEAAWLTMASDYNSDNIVLGVTTNATSSEAWTAIWNGSSWESSVLLETNTTGKIYPNLAVAF